MGSSYITNTFGINSANVGSNGVVLSAHGNVYAGTYYSTVNQFLAWPSSRRMKTDLAALDGGLLWARERTAYRYRVQERENIRGASFEGEPWWQGEHQNARKVAP